MVSCPEVTLNVSTPMMMTVRGLMYTVVYEDGDGDKEDLDPEECEEVVTHSDDVTIESGRVKEWELGDE